MKLEVEINDNKDWWNELNLDQQKAIEDAENELEAGLGIPHEEVMKKYGAFSDTSEIKS